MKQILKSIFQKETLTIENEKKNISPLFLTTHGLNYYIEELIKESKEYILILSPYLKICPRLKELLLQRKKSGVKIYIVCRSQDMKDDVTDIVTTLKDRTNLHAKCFISETSAIVCSLNLYDFSQINNDEMGFFFEKVEVPQLYGAIHAEAKRIFDSATVISESSHNSKELNQKNISQNTSSKNNSTNLIGTKFNLEIGEKYSLQDLDALFNFDYKKPSGIKSTQSEDLVLFMTSEGAYGNKESQDIIYFVGQNTGSGPQQLIYGNKQLYDTHGSLQKKIHLFKSYIYFGEYYVCKKPYVENDKWIFPITKIEHRKELSEKAIFTTNNGPQKATHIRLPEEFKRDANIIAYVFSEYEHTSLYPNATQQDAFLLAAQAIGIKKETLKQKRDSFDGHNNNHRKGYWQSPLLPDLQAIKEEFSTMSKEDVVALAQKILNRTNN